MAGIYWLASYLKSGNTWLRSLLTNYRRQSDCPADINALDGRSLATSRALFDDWVGVESSDMPAEQIAHYRPRLYEHLAASSAEPLFIKIHEAFTYTRDGQPLFPRAATAGVIYLIRNPLDVAVSYAHHEQKPLDDIIRRMRCPTYTMLARTDTVYGQLPQTVSSWSAHVRSWVDLAPLPLHLVRYEDMVRQPVATLRDIVRFAALPLDACRLHKAVAFSRFEVLQAQEVAHGFAEKQPTAPSFFRQGCIGSWRQELTAPQVQQLIADHGAMMRRFGYLTATDEVVC